jgi:hypothetical protein
MLVDWAFPQLLPLLPLLPYLLLVLGLCGTLAMYLTLKRDLAVQSKRSQRMETMLLRLRDAAGKRAAAPAVEPAASETPAYVPVSPRPGMNLSRRVQTLRLLRRGEDLGYIAAALGVPRREVELVVRVHQLTGQFATTASAGPPAARSAAVAPGPLPG